MDGGTLLTDQEQSHPPGLFHVLGLVGGWILLTALAEGVLFMFWFASTIAVFSVAGPLPTVVGVLFAVLALAVAPLGCAYIVRRGDRWLSADR
jgi:hypothetical protein